MLELMDLLQQDDGKQSLSRQEIAAMLLRFLLADTEESGPATTEKAALPVPVRTQQSFF